MTVDTCAFQALAAQVAELAERVSQLDKRALVIKTLNEMRIERSGYAPPRDLTGAELLAVLEEELALRGLPSPSRTGRPRHLRSVDGGQR